MYEYLSDTYTDTLYNVYIPNEDYCRAKYESRCNI